MDDDKELEEMFFHKYGNVRGPTSWENRYDYVIPTEKEVALDELFGVSK